MPQTAIKTKSPNTMCIRKTTPALQACIERADWKNKKALKRQQTLKMCTLVGQEGPHESMSARGNYKKEEMMFHFNSQCFLSAVVTDCR
jgi:hypothetical protein